MGGSCTRELRQLHDEMEWLSKMVRIVQSVEKFCKSGRGALQRALTRKENKVTENWTKIYKQDEKSEQEEVRKKNIMKERNKLRIWDPGG